MIIGLSGYARSGKDTAAEILVYEYGFVRVGFADKLRECLYAINPLIGVSGGSQGTRTVTWRLREFIDKFGWDGYKEADPYEYSGQSREIRELLQRLGTEAGRNILGENVWVDAALNTDAENIVVSDCRFPNEAQAIKDRGGEIWRVVRTGVGPANTHPSETSLDEWPFDAVIVNDGTLTDFEKSVIVTYLEKNQEVKNANWI